MNSEKYEKIRDEMKELNDKELSDLIHEIITELDCRMS